MVEVARARSKAGKFVPDRNASTKSLKRKMSGRTFAFLATLATTVIALGALMANNATAVPGARTISFFSPHTKQSVTVTYKRYGQYIPAAMRKINYLLRDWRTNQVVRMDPKLVDLLWEIHKNLGSRKPIHILSGFRSQKTNAMLRRRSRGVSRFSRHMFGMAADVRFPDISLERLRNSAMLRQRGGVGYYRGSFVHVDVGTVRHWPRMSKRQLAKLFPNGRSPHISGGARKSAPRNLPRSVVVASAPAGVVRGRAPARIVTPSQVQFASRKPSRKRKPQKTQPPAIRLARFVPIPRTKPVAVTTVQPVLRAAVPLPRARPNAQFRLAALSTPAPEVPKPPKAPEIIVASAAIRSSTLAGIARKEVLIARPVRNAVEVITARPLQPAKQKRGLFGFASLAPKSNFNDDPISRRVASAIKSNRRPLASLDLMKVNRTLKGDRLPFHIASKNTGSRIQLASRLGASKVTSSVQNRRPVKENPPESPEQPPAQSPRPFGLLSALFPMFSGDSQPLKRR